YIATGWGGGSLRDAPRETAFRADNRGVRLLRQVGGSTDLAHFLGRNQGWFLPDSRKSFGRCGIDSNKLAETTFLLPSFHAATSRRRRVRREIVFPANGAERLRRVSGWKTRPTIETMPRSPSLLRVVGPARYDESAMPQPKPGRKLSSLDKAAAA